MSEKAWHDLGPVEQFRHAPVSEVKLGPLTLAITWQNGEFGAISGLCNHVGGPFGQGGLDGEYVVCPWHHWKFHCRTGLGEPGYEEDSVPSHAVKVQDGHLFVSPEAQTPRRKKKHPPHPLARPVQRAAGPIRVAGISTTHMDREHPRYSTSEALLDVALEHAQSALACETRLLRLDELRIRNCEGYYSKSARACTWPCSITEMDKNDQMEQVYEVLVHWADVVLLATPIRWGASSALYIQNGGTAQLCAEPDHHQGHGADSQQGRRFHHGRPGQRAGRGRTPARFLFRTRFHVSAVPVHCPFARLVGRGHGAQ
jgi:nitrite reductase/ring-hydroxylating ferredoxin subunit